MNDFLEREPEMELFVRREVERAAYLTLEAAQPKLVALIEKLLSAGYTPDRILEFCAARSGVPAERLSVIGCAADYRDRCRREESAARAEADFGYLRYDFEIG